MAHKRQKKFDAMASWSMGMVVNIPLALLHISVGLFFLGLWKYLKAKDNILGFVIGAAAVMVAAIYLFFTLHPLIADTPFSTPFTPMIPRLYPQKKLREWSGRISNVPSLWSFAENISNRWEFLKKPMLYVIYLLKPFRSVSHYCSHSKLHDLFASPFRQRKNTEKQAGSQINALVWLLHMPLKYADVRDALKTLLELATSEAAELLRKQRLVDCIASCLRSIIHDGRIAEKRHDLAAYCVRILSFNQISSDAPPQLPEDFSVAFDELIERHQDVTDEHVRLLSGSIWLLPSEKRKEASFHWAKRNLINPSLSDTVSIKLLHDAYGWLLAKSEMEQLDTSLDLDALEETPVPPIEVIRALLPFLSIILSDPPIAKHTEPRSLPQLIETSLSHLRKLNRPRWICQVVSAIWRDNPHLLNESIANILFDWMRSLGNDYSNILPLLDAITHGPKAIPTNHFRPLTTLAQIYEQVTNAQDLPNESWKHNVESCLVAAYSAIFEHAFAASRGDDLVAAKLDFEESYKFIAEYMTAGGLGDRIQALGLLSNTFHTVLFSTSPDHVPFTPLIVDALDNQDDSRPELVRWTCSIVRVICGQYPKLVEKSTIANRLITSASRSSEMGSSEVLSLKMAAIIHGPKAYSNIEPLTTIANIYELVLSRSSSSNHSQINELRNKILHAYASIIGSKRVRPTVRDGDHVEYSQDIGNSIAIITRPLERGLKENRKIILSTVYPLTIMFWHLKPAIEHVELLRPYRDLFVDLLTGTSGLTGDPDDIDCDLDIKFYCADLLANIFMFDAVKKIDRMKFRRILPLLEAIAIDDKSLPRLRWKAIYTLVEMTWYYDPAWYFDMKLTCSRIASDIGKRISRGEVFAPANHEWRNIPPFYDCGLAPTMRQIRSDQFLNGNTYNWKKGVPLLHPIRPLPQTQPPPVSRANRPVSANGQNITDHIQLRGFVLLFSCGVRVRMLNGMKISVLEFHLERSLTNSSTRDVTLATLW
jgi:Family of unknown function (DUF6535)